MDGGCLCEAGEACPNGHYGYSYAYGFTEFWAGDINNHFADGYSYSTPRDVQERIGKAFDAFVTQYKKSIEVIE
jgi:hypothetical protein